MSSNNLDKYEYLTVKDLGLKPNTIEQAKFEYSPLGKIFNKGLDKDNKKGLFKSLKNVENAQKNLIRDGNNKSIYYSPRLKLMMKMINKKNQNNNINAKLPNVFIKKFKSRSKIFDG